MGETMAVRVWALGAVLVSGLAMLASLQDVWEVRRAESHLREARRENVSEREGLERAKKSVQAERDARAAAENAVRDAERKALEAKAPPPPAPPAQTPPERTPPPGFPGHAMMLETMRWAYADFLKDQPWDQARREQFLEKVAKGPGTSDDELLAWLGEPAATQFKEFQKTIPDRMRLRATGMRMLMAGHPLAPDQETALVKQLAELPRTVPEGKRAGTFEGFQAIRQAENQRLLIASSNVLSAPQLETLRGMLDQEAGYMKMGWQMMEQMQKGQPGASQSTDAAEGGKP